MKPVGLLDRVDGLFGAESLMSRWPKSMENFCNELAS